MLITSKSREDWNMVKDECSFKAIKSTASRLTLTYDNKPNGLLWLYKVLNEEHIAYCNVINSLVMSAYMLSYCPNIIHDNITIKDADRYGCVLKSSDEPDDCFDLKFDIFLTEESIISSNDNAKYIFDECLFGEVNVLNLVTMLSDLVFNHVKATMDFSSTYKNWKKWSHRTPFGVSFLNSFKFEYGFVNMNGDLTNREKWTFLFWYLRMSTEDTFDKKLFDITPDNVLPPKLTNLKKAIVYMTDTNNTNPLYSLIDYVDCKDTAKCKFIEIVADIIVNKLPSNKLDYQTIENVFDYISSKPLLVNNSYWLRLDNLKLLANWLFPEESMDVWFDINRIKYCYVIFTPDQLKQNIELPRLLYDEKYVDREIIINEDTLMLSDWGEDILDCYHHLEEVRAGNYMTNIYKYWFRDIKTKKEVLEAIRELKHDVADEIQYVFGFVQHPYYVSDEVRNVYLKPILDACLTAWLTSYENNKKIKAKAKLARNDVRCEIAKIAISEMLSQYIDMRTWAMLNKQRDIVTAYAPKGFNVAALNAAINCLEKKESALVKDFRAYHNMNYHKMPDDKYIGYIIDGYVSLYSMYLDGDVPDFDKFLNDDSILNQYNKLSKTHTTKVLRQIIVTHKKWATDIVSDTELLGAWTIGNVPINDTVKKMAFNIIKTKYFPKTEYFMANTILAIIKTDTKVKHVTFVDMCHNGKPCDFD